MIQKDPKLNKKKPSLIPYYIALFFLIIVVVNVGYIIVSNKSWRGVFITDSYRKGLEYNKTLKQAEEQSKLGWTLDVKTIYQKPQISRIKITIFDNTIRTISGAEVFVNFKRPTQEGYDFSVKLDEIGKFYEKQVRFPLKGQWDFVVIINKEGNIYREVKRFVIR